MSKKIDYLDEDEPLRSQKFCCFSFLSPEGIKNCSIRGLKIRGSYNTYEEAKRRAEQLQKIDPDFHVFVGEVGKWLPWDPDPNSVEDNVYREKELNDLMREYKKNRERTKEVEGLRKQTMLKRGDDDRKKKIQERLRKKLAEKEKEKLEEKEKKENQILEVEKVNDEDIFENKKEELKLKEKGINNLKKDSTELNNKLNKIKNLYNKLKVQDNNSISNYN
tara:strand:- start:177 stop:836 length:660 start_codon:yes stop_codon:yes gene_type:complete